ncbi:MAG: pseudoazurin [Porticoccus sp.]|jgi:pseudoazurin|tara:strand:+ start:407 stop:1030 length:624 start_codon:yes stop_codon:yes gene_type:complete
MEKRMSQFTKMGFAVASLVIFLGIAGCGSDEKELILTPQQEKEIAERLTPIGEVVLQKDIATSMPAIVSTVSAPKVELSEGSEHIIKMLNSGSGGSMVFEPAVIKVSKGDTIHFKATDMSHNSVSMDGMIPEGASSWAGQLNQDITVKLDSEGVYVYQCDPHAMMAMIGVIQVGEAVNLSEVKNAAIDKKSAFMMNSDRLDTYLSQL